MNVTCIREKLKNAVSTAERLTGKNLSLPVLNSLLLVAEKDTIRIRATNLDLGIELVIPARVEQSGVVAIPGNVLHNLLGSIQDDSVSLVSREGNLSISSQKNAATINGVEHEDFPTLPSVKSNNSFQIPAHSFVSGLRSVWYSAALSDLKPEIASVYLYTDGEYVVFVATDSFRLAEKRIRVKDTSIESLMIPIRNVAEIVRIFEGKESILNVSFNKNQIAIYDDGVYVTSRLIDGTFPDYKQIIPKTHTTEVIVLKNDFVGALKATTIFADKFNQVTFFIDPQKHVFEVSSHNKELGKNTTRLEATTSGEKSTTHFNHKYILDCIQAVPVDSLSLSLNGPGKPLVVRGVGDESFLYLVMPLNN